MSEGSIEALPAGLRRTAVPFAPAQEGSSGSSVCHPRVLVADIDGERFQEASRGPVQTRNDGGVISVAVVTAVLRFHIVAPTLNSACCRVDAVDIARNSTHQFYKMPKIDMFQIFR